MQNLQDFTVSLFVAEDEVFRSVGKAFNLMK